MARQCAHIETQKQVPKQLKNRTVPLSGTGLLIELYRRIPAFNNPAVARMKARVDYHFQLPYSQKLIQVTSRHTQEPKLKVYFKKNVHNDDICSLYEGQKGCGGQTTKGNFTCMLLQMTFQN